MRKLVEDSNRVKFCQKKSRRCQKNEIIEMKANAKFYVQTQYIQQGKGESYD